jgi:hypothetical protein
MCQILLSAILVSAIRWLWRWPYSLTLDAFLQMSVLTLSLVLAVLHTRRS